MAARLNLNSRFKNGPLLELKISLEYAHHDIWRQIIVPAEATYADLHLVIQGAFIWKNYHSYQFIVEGGRLLPSTQAVNDFVTEHNTEEDVLEAGDVELSVFLNVVGTTIVYEYDFDKNWIHSIELCRVFLSPPALLPAILPDCVAGAGYGIPENCTGVFGYDYLCYTLDLTEDERSVEQDALIDWLRETYPNYVNPLTFSAQDALFHITASAQ